MFETVFSSQQNLNFQADAQISAILSKILSKI